MLADQIKQALHQAAKTTPWADHAPARAQDFPLETPKKAEHGHYATNMAMRLAKPLKRAPIQIAQELAAAVDTSGVIESVEVVNPGFINIRVSAAALRSVAVQTLEQGESYGKTGVGQGAKVQVEFVSANPTGPLSVGHGRLAAYGDSLARTLAAAGFAVQREFYVNDVGNQIEKLARSIFKRTSQSVFLNLRRSDFQTDEKYIQEFKRAFKENVTPFTTHFQVNEDDYQGDDVIAASAIITEASSELLNCVNINLDLFRSRKPIPNVDDFTCENDVQREEIQSLLIHPECNFSESRILNEFAIKAVDVYLEKQQNTLKQFGVVFDKWFRESELYQLDGVHNVEQVNLVLNKLRETGDMYEKEGAVWFASSKYLDEKDRVVQKSDGNKTYLMSDIAYIYNKLGVRGFDTAIYVWGADHHGYIDRIKSAGQALGFAPERLEVIIVQLVSIKGERMSKRRGNIIYLDELIEDVGADATRFFFLTRPPGTHCDFDMDLARDKSENNPMYYLQYVHARICSMMEKAGEANLAPDPAALDRLAEPVEMELLKLIADFPWEVQGAALAREPHRIINYLTAVAGKFHSFYHDHKVIQQDDESLSRARLALCGAVRTVFRNGLDMLGISAPEKM